MHSKLIKRIIRSPKRPIKKSELPKGKSVSENILLTMTRIGNMEIASPKGRDDLKTISTELDKLKEFHMGNGILYEPIGILYTIKSKGD
jgi:hypothetical protein